MKLKYTLFFLIMAGSIVLSTPCTTNDDCTTPEASVCSGGTCTNCYSNTECAHIPPKTVCDTSTLPFQCIECFANPDCQTTTKSRCESKTCVTCLTSSDCSHMTGGNTQCSVLLGGVCVACLNDADCGGGMACNSNGVCTIACASDSDSDCTNPIYPFCHSTLGMCSKCGADSHCNSDPTKGQCSSAAGECVPCSTSNQCAQFPSTPVCNAGGCVECVADSDCLTSEAAQCSGSNTCITCTDSSQCAHFSSTPFCNDPGVSGVCVQCFIDSNCPTPAAAHCSSNTCTTCTSNSQCTHLSSTPLCNAESGACVQCLTNSDCTSSETPLCSASSNTCVPCDGVSPGCTPTDNGTLGDDPPAQSEDSVSQRVAAAISASTTTSVIVVLSATAVNTFTKVRHSSRGFTTLRMTKLAALIRYINTDFSEQPEKLFQAFKNTQKFLRSMLSTIFGSDQYNQTTINLPSRFVMFEDSSLFLKNAGMNVLVSSFVVIAILLIRLGMGIARQRKKTAMILKLQKAQKIFEWNYILGWTVATYPDLIIGVGLQFYDLPFSDPSFLNMTSFVICVLIAPFAVLFPFICLTLMKADKSERKRKYHNITRYESLITDFNENDSNTKTYQVLNLLRIPAIVLPLIFCKNSPLTQVVVMMLCSIVINGFRLLRVTYKRGFTKFVIVGNEVLILISLIAVFLQVIFTHSGFIAEHPITKEVLGWIIAVPLLTLILLNAMVALLDALRNVVRVLKGIANRSKTKKGANKSPTERVQARSPATNKSMQMLIPPTKISSIGSLNNVSLQALDGNTRYELSIMDLNQNCKNNPQNQRHMGTISEIEGI